MTDSAIKTNSLVLLTWAAAGVLAMIVHVVMTATLVYSVNNQIRGIETQTSLSTRTVQMTLDKTEESLKLLNDRTPLIKGIEKQSDDTARLLIDRTPLLLDMQKEIEALGAFLKAQHPNDDQIAELVRLSKTVSALQEQVIADSEVLKQEVPVMKHTSEAIDQLQVELDRLHHELKMKAGEPATTQSVP